MGMRLDQPRPRVGRWLHLAVHAQSRGHTRGVHGCLLAGELAGEMVVTP